MIEDINTNSNGDILYVRHDSDNFNLHNAYNGMKSLKNETRLFPFETNFQVIQNTFVLAAYVDAHKRNKVELRANLWHALTTDILEITVF